MKPFYFVLLLAALVPLSASAATRTWTDAQGRTVKGSFVRIHNGEVIIQKLDKKVARVPYWGLSETDREFVKKELEAKGEAIPPEPAKPAPVDPGAAGAGAAGVGAGPGPGSFFPPGVGPGPAMPGSSGAAGGYSPPGSSMPGSSGGYTPPGGSGAGMGSFPGRIGGSRSGPSTMPGSSAMPGDVGSGGYTASSQIPTMPSYTPAPIEFPSIKYKLRCGKCGYTFDSDTPDIFQACPSCGNNGRASTRTAASSATMPGNSMPGSSASSTPGYSPPSYSPSYTSSSSSADEEAKMAARRAGALAVPLLALACVIGGGFLFMLLIIAVIYFVIKAVSAPPAVPVRRHY